MNKFHIWAFQNFPFMEETYKEIDNYHLMMDILHYLKEESKDFKYMTEKFEELEKWFNNLDVQEEIDNKLDEMVESGELQEIIADYLNSKAIFAYDNVSSMKSATNLISGSYAKTFGYYSKGDGGSSYYKIREVTNEDIVDEMNIIAMSDESLIAEIIVIDDLNIKQYGAKGDGINDDTSAVKKALESSYNVYFPHGTYNINEKINVEMNNKKIYGEQAELFYVPGGRLNNTAIGQNVYKFTGSNLIIDGLIFNANNEYIRRPHQTGTTDYNTWLSYRSNSMECLRLNNIDNIKVTNCTIKGGLFKLYYITNFILEKCKVIETPADSYYIQDGCHNGLVLKCYASKNGDDTFSTNVDDYTDAPSNITYDSCYADDIEGAMFCCYGSHDVKIIESQGDNIKRNGGFRVQKASASGHETQYSYNIIIENCIFNLDNNIGGNDTSSGRGTNSPFIENNSDKSFNSNIRINNCTFNRESGSALYYLYFLNASDIIIDKCKFKNINLRTLDFGTSRIQILNSTLELNQELYIYGSDNFKVINCNISNDCTQATTDIETGLRACISNYSSYYNVYRNNTYTVSTDGAKNYIKIASNFSPNGNQLFISDNANLKNYHTNYNYNYVFDIPNIVVTETVTPSGTSRSYVTINYNLDYEPKAVIPVGITPSANADASLNNLMVQSFGKTSAIVRYSANVANLEYKIKLIIVM